jgi:hypothetical protein
VSILKVVESDAGPLLLVGGGSRHVSVDHLIELTGADGREELELSTKSRLENRESLRKSIGVGRHCKLEISVQVYLKRQNFENGNGGLELLYTLQIQYPGELW